MNDTNKRVVLSVGMLKVIGQPFFAFKEEYSYDLPNENIGRFEKEAEILKNMYSDVEPYTLRLLDPCLKDTDIVYAMIDILMEIYERCGINYKNALTSIVNNNIWAIADDKEKAYKIREKIKERVAEIFPPIDTESLHPNIYYKNYDKISESDFKKSAIYGSIVEKEFNTLLEELESGSDITKKNWERLKALCVQKKDPDSFSEMQRFYQMESVVNARVNNRKKGLFSLFMPEEDKPVIKEPQREMQLTEKTYTVDDESNAVFENMRNIVGMGELLYSRYDVVTGNADSNEKPGVLEFAKKMSIPFKEGIESMVDIF